MTVKATTALLSLSLVAGTLGAQQRPAAQRTAAAQPQAPKCDIQSSGSAQVTGAYEALSKYNEAQAEADKPQHLRTATRLLTGTPDKAGVDVARHWVMAQTLVAWSLTEGTPIEAPRSAYGFAANGDQPLNILAAADSLLTAVQEAKPGCASQIENMRRLGYVATANRAVALFNAGQLDSAGVLAESANRIFAGGAPTYHLLGNIAVKKQDYPAAAVHLQQAAELAKGDSSLTELRQGALENVAMIYANQAAQAQGDEQRALGAKAVAVYRELIAMQPQNAALQTGLAQALQMAGDTAAVSGMYTKMVADPSSYSSMQLLDAGIGAANADRMQDAVALLEAGLAKNQFYRDALFALTYAYSATGNYAKMSQTASRLIAVDPSNPDNYNLLAQAYQGLLSEAQDKNLKRTYTDSMIKITAQAERMPVRVVFSDFQVSTADQRVLNGTVENRGDAPASYTLRFQFLDEQGNVVTTKDEVVSEVPAKGSKPFSIAVQGQGIASFRYAPLP